MSILNKKGNSLKEKLRHKRAKKYILIAAIVLAVIFVIIPLILLCINRFSIKFNVEDNETVVVEYGIGCNEPQITATYTASILKFMNKDLKVTKEGDYDINALGEYVVTYSCEYKNKTARITRTYKVEDNTAPVITLVDNPDYYTKPGDKYIEEGFSAIDNYDGDVTAKVVRQEKDNVITYTVTDSFGNEAKVERPIVYEDREAPVIVLNGNAEIDLGINETYSELGYTATDDIDGDLTSKVTVEGKVDSSKYGDYKLTYKVKDSYDNETVVTRIVHVKDFNPPVITMNNDAKITIKVGEKYTDDGASAYDEIDGDLTSKMTVTNNVDTSKIGVYSVVYSVTDSSGNQANAQRIVYVYDKQSDVTTIDPGDKVVYLTFDDGPYKYTQQLLDILDKYGVKVTFFVTNQYSDYQYLIGEEYKRGHTVAVHTYSHKYDQIYSSEDAFFQDIQAMADVCAAQTGVKPDILRFPGGSSNTTSKKYCPGIMTSLSQSVGLMGYQYSDWNVSSGDAGETTSSSQVAANVIEGMKNHKVSVVLQHDIKQFSVEAVEEIIQWGLANGYKFLPMDKTSPMAHHGINN